MRKEIIEIEQKVPVSGECDVLVIGGGVAGISAALSAARAGRSVTLIEKSILLGGLATAGHVCIYLPLDDGLGHRIYGGNAEELLYTTIRYGYDTLPDCWRKNGEKSVDRVEAPAPRYESHFNIPAAIMAFDELLKENHVKVVFDALYSASIMDGDTCRGVIVETKSGREAYLAKMIIDCSGDADVMARSGADCVEQDSIVSHWAFEIDRETMQKGVETGNAFDAFALRWLGLRPDADNSKSKLPRFAGTTSEGVNGYVKLSREIALDYLKKHQDRGYTMISLPAMAQFRTSRRIRGMKELTLDPGVSIEDSVGCVINCLDRPAKVYEFPYGAVIDAKLTNLFAAGRNVAAGGVGWEIMRYIPGCVFTGQVAGTAAAMAIDAGCAVQDIDVSKLQRKLAETGVMIHMSDDLRDNDSKRAYEIPQGAFDPHIRNDSLAYGGH